MHVTQEAAQNFSLLNVETENFAKFGFMNYSLWKFLSGLNKALLPKIYKSPDLMKLSSLQKAVVGWKMFVTYKFLDASKSQGKEILK